MDHGFPTSTTSKYKNTLTPDEQEASRSTVLTSEEKLRWEISELNRTIISFGRTFAAYAEIEQEQKRELFARLAIVHEDHHKLIKALNRARLGLGGGL